MADTLTQALAYAKEGWPVFPCRPGSKKPLTDHGFKDASTDAERIRDWWRRWPRANVAIATGGETSGIIVVDIDVKNGVNGFESIAEHGLSSDTFSTETPSGGAHLYFRTQEKWSNRQTWDELPGVDVRGDGGYVLAPPSVLCDDKGKRIGSYIFGNGLPIMFLADTDWPKWLRRKKEIAPTPAPKLPRVATTKRSAVMAATIKQEADKVRNASPGTRSNTLNVAAGVIGGHLWECPQYSDEAVQSLMEASMDNGHIADDGESKIISTINSGLRWGRERPLEFSDSPGWDPKTPKKKKAKKRKKKEDAEGWEAELMRFASGALKSGTFNIAKIIENDPDIKDTFGLDERIKTTTWLKRPSMPANLVSPKWPIPREFGDADDTAINNWCAQKYGYEPGAKNVHAAVKMIARLNSFDRVREYLEGLHWDGEKRIDRWLCNYMGTPEQAPWLEVGAKWLCSAVARTFAPGCKVDHVLVLEGDSGIGKSTCFEILGGEYYSGAKYKVGDKDAEQALAQSWIVELAELAAVRRHDKEAVKHWITLTGGRFRLAYERHPVLLERRSVFGGSTNSNEYLTDEDSSRRWWSTPTAPVVDRAGKMLCDTDGLRRDRDQLWAEAVVRYRSGEKLYLSAHSEAAMDEYRATRMVRHPWDDRVAEFVEGRPRVRMSEVLGQLKDLGQQTWSDQAVVSSALTRLGWTRRHHRDGKFWHPPD